MKRISQILASIAFVIIVVSIYLVFDLVINNALLKSNRLHKHTHTDQEIHQNKHIHDDQRIHNHIHKNANSNGDTKIPKRRSIISSTLTSHKRVNRIIKPQNVHENHHDIDEHLSRTTKRRSSIPPRHPKPANFHKGKTGVKVNKPQKNARELRKTHVLTTAASPNKQKRSIAYKKHDS